MQLINGVPIDKVECKVLIGIQIRLAALRQEEQLPESVKKSMQLINGVPIDKEKYMQLINGVPIDKVECKVLIGIQIRLAALRQEEQLPESVKKSMDGYFFRCGK